jgi:hypothetical protein
MGAEWYHWKPIQRIDARAASGGSALMSQPKTVPTAVRVDAASKKCFT